MPIFIKFILTALLFLSVVPQVTALSFVQTAEPQKQITINGTVTDPEGQPIIGAGILFEGLDGKGTTTNLDGWFEMEIPLRVKTLQIISMGMKTEQYDLTKGPKTHLHIVLQYEENLLENAVITGYAQTTVKRITGSVGIMNADKFESKPLSSVSSLMQGEVAGVQIQAVSGQPGTQAKIRIRGNSNLSGSSEPLWVVDGVPVQNDVPTMSNQELATGGFDNIFVNGIGNINPNDIDNITILKDAAAAAIYGSRAANGVIVVSTKRGNESRMRVSYNNNFTWSFKPQRSLNLMNSAEKLDWEDELWKEFGASRYEQHQTDPATICPIVGIVGQIRSGAGQFAGMKNDPAAQDAYIAGLKSSTTDWYGLLFRNSFSHNHHLSLSGGSKKYTYYVSGGFNDDKGMLIHNDYRRYNLNANVNLKPNDAVRIDFGFETARQESKNPESSVNPFTYAYFANPYEKAYREDGSYAADNTYFSLGYFNGRENELVMPKDGFNIMRELDNNYTKTVNTSNTLRAQIDLTLARPLKFIGLASWSFSNNATDKVIGKNTYSAFKDRLGNDDKSQTKLYGNISQNRANRNSYVVRGHFSYNQTFGGRHTLNVLAGSELRGSNSNTIFTKRYNYDPVTGTSSLPEISGPADQWLKQVERLNGQYFTKNRYASFYASADYYLGDTFVFNTSIRSDGSSNFGSKQQFNPTWSAGAAWHIGEEPWMKQVPVISHATLRAAFGYTGDISTLATHQLVMKYYSQEFRYYNDQSYMLGYLPSAPNPNLGWEKTADGKIGLDFGLWKDRLTLNTEVYLRKSSDVVSSSQVQSNTGFTYVHFNSADILNSGVETTLNGKIVQTRDWKLDASLNFAYNYNKVTRYRPSSNIGITAKDRYIEGYPIGAIIAGQCYGIDPQNGLYGFRLREDADIAQDSDLNRPDNYRYYLGTSIAPYTGGINLSLSYKQLKFSISGVYSFGAKVYDKIESPASYLNARHSGINQEEVQSQYSDLYSNHLNVNRDRTDRWTPDRTTGVKYPRIYDCFDPKYNFAASNPMDWNIVDAIYLKDKSYLRIKSMILTYSLPQSISRKMKMQDVSINLSMNNFLTFTRYDGMDPEVAGATYPTTRSISAGLRIEF